jgi:hypothetical protein
MAAPRSFSADARIARPIVVNLKKAQIDTPKTMDIPASSSRSIWMCTPNRSTTKDGSIPGGVLWTFE